MNRTESIRRLLSPIVAGILSAAGCQADWAQPSVTLDPVPSSARGGGAGGGSSLVKGAEAGPGHNPIPAGDDNRPHLPQPGQPTLEPMPYDPGTAAAGDEPKPQAELIPSAFAARISRDTRVVDDVTLLLPTGTAPAQGDILIGFDLTGSMGGELANMKVNTLNIYNAVRAVIPDLRFGMISFMDYPTSYNSCGYNGTYAVSYDQVYTLHSPLTSDDQMLSEIVNELVLGNGKDKPEAYSRAFYESYSDDRIGWRPGAKRILLSWGDSIPHDCRVDEIIGGSSSTGVDPGRDGIADTPDDLKILDVLAGMAADDITLIALYSGPSSSLPLWQAYSERTGGAAFQLNSDGSVPSGTDIASTIANLIQDEVTLVEKMEIRSCEAPDSEWIRSVSPPAYSNVNLSTGATLPFSLELAAPPHAEDGTHCFEVCAVGDGAELARHQICLTISHCGDGILDEGEQCDDGNITSADGCSAECVQEEALPICGDARLDEGETCDDGNRTPGDGCSETCQLEDVPPVCGNGLVESGEECDDGNLSSGDGCADDCHAESIPTTCGTGLDPASGGDLLAIGHSSPGDLLAIDSNTGRAGIAWSGVEAFPVDIGTTGLSGVTALAADLDASQLFLVTGDGDDALWSISLSTGDPSRVGTLSHAASNVQALALAPDVAEQHGFSPRALYAISIDGISGCGPNCLFEIDRRSGVATPLAALAANQIRGMSFDPLSGLLWVYDPGGKHLFTVTIHGEMTWRATLESSHQDSQSGVDTMFSLAHTCDGRLFGIDMAYGVLLKLDSGTGKAAWVGGYGSIVDGQGSFDVRGLVRSSDLACECP